MNQIPQAIGLNLTVKLIVDDSNVVKSFADLENLDFKKRIMDIERTEEKDFKIYKSSHYTATSRYATVINVGKDVDEVQAGDTVYLGFGDVTAGREYGEYALVHIGDIIAKL